ncbi:MULTISPECIES: tail protein X [unclassified Vibrio]|uniref:tail protein X n=1 Tax=unclassified Vibrio TaxID=2614977 RepID=UPI001360CE12|nr:MULTISPECIES: tail protein X [unclassified Vibrio]NAW56616.1 phage tail protein [Vibrio sp. V36_P2S2PM302]NAX21016.1 phage tail protein [Vibrio sp. V39_P1S14PM300]NAX27325.1 phage tail protein [Vibrio sp. V38_P2S17PM301]NAX29026.1 phage tail protein [Vibrio sp. V37_P2S8PM304]
MAKRYLTRDGDVLDDICYQEYGTEQAVIAVLEANPKLADQGTKLQAGLIITLPDYTPPSQDDEDVLWS